MPAPFASHQAVHRYSLAFLVWREGNVIALCERSGGGDCLLGGGAGFSNWDSRIAATPMLRLATTAKLLPKEPTFFTVERRTRLESGR